MNETPTPPEGFRIIPRAYLEAGNPLPEDAIVWFDDGDGWEVSCCQGGPTQAHAIAFYATAQPLPCFQKGGDEPCPPYAPSAEATTQSVPRVAVGRNAPVAVQSTDQGPEPPAGIELIKAERERQISEEGWTPEHDDEHRLEEMIEAAAVYMAQASEYCSPLQDVSWPWSDASFKPSKDDPVRDLVKAGALIAAEIDRRQRAANFTTPTEQLSGTDRSVPGKPNEITARSGEPIPPPGFQIALPDDPQLPGAMGWIKGEDFGWEPLAKNVSREEWIIANPAQPVQSPDQGPERVAPEPPAGYRLLTDEEKKQPLPMDALAYLGEEWLPSRAAGRMAGKSDQRETTYATRLSETKQTPERCRRVMADSDGAHRCQLPSNHSEACVFPMGRLPVVPSPTAEQRIAELARERDEARALFESMRKLHKHAISQWAECVNMLRDARAQLAASEKDRMRLAKEILSTGDAKDRERLDWLQDYLRKQPTFDGKYYWHEGGADTLRAAIDAAMKEAK